MYFNLTDVLMGFLSGLLGNAYVGELSEEELNKSKTLTAPTTSSTPTTIKTTM